uniref:Solute carrier family 22 member 3 n=1 Tax=Meleagris gallopavo TaxID=9103 RepID=A0A803YPG7_MELGA
MRQPAVPAPSPSASMTEWAAHHLPPARTPGCTNSPTPPLSASTTLCVAVPGCWISHRLSSTWAFWLVPSPLAMQQTGSDTSRSYLDFKTRTFISNVFCTHLDPGRVGHRRYGRILIYLLSCLGVGICGIIVAFAPNFTLFLIFRFLQGVFGKGTWMTCYVIVTEIVGSDQRIVGIVIQIFFTLGIMILPGIAYLVPTWQGIQLAISLPNFLFLLYYWVVPESPRWLLTRKKGEKALKIMHDIAKHNGKYLSPHYSEITVSSVEVTNPSFLDLVRTPRMRRNTLILMYAWFTSALIYQGLVMRLGIVGGNLYLDFFISGAVELPAALLILITIDRIGRRLPFAIGNIVAGIACLITAFLPEDIPWFKTTVATLGRLGITIAFEIVYLVNSELYPTTLRNFGVSLCSSLCDLGGIIAPFLLFRLAAIWLELPLIIFSILAAVCGILVLLLPETKGISLPETVEDVEQLSGHYGKCGKKKKHQNTNSYI